MPDALQIKIVFVRNPFVFMAFSVSILLWQLNSSDFIASVIGTLLFEELFAMEIIVVSSYCTWNRILHTVLKPLTAIPIRNIWRLRSLDKITQLRPFQNSEMWNRNWRSLVVGWWPTFCVNIWTGILFLRLNWTHGDTTQTRI